MNHKRLHTRLLALLLCCALVLPLSACGEAKSTTQQIFAMDTVMDLTAYGKKADDGISAAISGFDDTALESGPMASATPMSRKARKMGRVLSCMGAPGTPARFGPAEAEGKRIFRKRICTN